MIFVADASDDYMAAGARLSSDDPRVTVLETTSRRFKAENYYALLPYMTGEVVLELDADDYLASKDALAEIASKYDDPSVGACTGTNYGVNDDLPYRRRMADGDIHRNREGFDVQGHIIAQCPRSWRTGLSRMFLERFGESVLLDPATGKHFEASGDVAISHPAFMLAQRIALVPRNLYELNPLATEHDALGGGNIEQDRACKAMILALRKCEATL